MTQTIDGWELRRRIFHLRISYTRAAELLGLTLDGLQKQMRGDRPVSRQTQLLLECLEREREHSPPSPHGGARPAYDSGKGETPEIEAMTPDSDAQAMLVMEQTIEPGLLNNSARGVTWRASCKIGAREYTAESDLGAVYELARKLVAAGIPDQPVTVLSEGLGRVAIRSLAWMATVRLIADPGGPPKLIRHVDAPSRKIRAVLRRPTR
jgi:hypothetical protein